MLLPAAVSTITKPHLPKQKAGLHVAQVTHCSMIT